MNNMMNYIQQSFYQACTYLYVDNMYNSTTEISNFVDDDTSLSFIPSLSLSDSL